MPFLKKIFLIILVLFLSINGFAQNNSTHPNITLKLIEDTVQTSTNIYVLSVNYQNISEVTGGKIILESDTGSSPLYSEKFRIETRQDDLYVFSSVGGKKVWNNQLRLYAVIQDNLVKKGNLIFYFKDKTSSSFEINLN